MFRRTRNRIGGFQKRGPRVGALRRRRVAQRPEPVCGGKIAQVAEHLVERGNRQIITEAYQHPRARRVGASRNTEQQRVDTDAHLRHRYTIGGTVSGTARRQVDIGVEQADVAFAKNAHMRAGRSGIPDRIEVQRQHGVLSEHDGRAGAGQDTRQRIGRRARNRFVHGQRRTKHVGGEPRDLELHLLRGVADARHVLDAERDGVPAGCKLHKLLPDDAFVGAGRFAKGRHQHVFGGFDEFHHRGALSHLEARDITGRVPLALAGEAQHPRRQAEGDQRESAVGGRRPQKGHGRHERDRSGAGDESHAAIQPLHVGWRAGRHRSAGRARRSIRPGRIDG